MINLKKILTDLLDFHAPVKTTKIKKKSREITEPWITKGILNYSKRIYKLFINNLNKDRNHPEYTEYLKQRNKLKSMKRFVLLEPNK